VQNGVTGTLIINNCKDKIILSLTLILLCISFMMVMAKGALASEKIHIGVVENVMLLPWGIVLPARIDTGAASSSLDARDIKIDGNTVTFRLAPQYGGVELSLPIVERKTIRSAEKREKRVVVEMEICIASKRLRTRVNLNDRSGVQYPMLLGRNILMKHFIIDCSQTKCTTPNCPEVSPQ